MCCCSGCSARSRGCGRGGARRETDRPAVPLFGDAAPGIPRAKGRRARVDQAAQRVKGSGSGSSALAKQDKPAVSPFLMAFFLFVVVGSAVLQVLNKLVLGTEP